MDAVGLFPLSDEKFLRAGGNTDNLRMPDEFGGGFLADVELFHQMHWSVPPPVYQYLFPSNLSLCLIA